MNGDSGEEDRLARWSRLKSEAAAPSPPEPAEPDLVDDAFIAALPGIEEIDATTDIRGFLRAGVPTALRNAALAKMWSADPAIRDRIPDAVDYAENYNAPHTISGWGASCPQEARAAVERVLEPQSGETEKPPPESERIVSHKPSTPVENAPAEATQDADSAGIDSPTCEEKVAKTRPRHGGALPQIG